MEKPENKKRDLVLCGRIDSCNVKDIIREVFEINSDDEAKEVLYKDWKRDPIKLFIHSCGGDVYSGLALIDIIKNSKTPIHTICIGACMSMALWVWLSGQKRLIGEHGVLMFHDVSMLTGGKTEEIKQDLNEAVRLQQLMMEEITSKSLIKEETLMDFISRKAEWFISAKEAIAVKLADSFYKLSQK